VKDEKFAAVLDEAIKVQTRVVDVRELLISHLYQSADIHLTQIGVWVLEHSERVELARRA